MSKINNEEVNFVFVKTNYILMIIGVLLIFIGLMLLSGGGSPTPNEFSDAIFDTQRLVVAPIIMMIGFIIEIFAIMYRPKTKA